MRKFLLLTALFTFAAFSFPVHAKKKTKEDLIEKFKRLDTDSDGKFTVAECLVWGKRKGIKTEEAAKKKHAQWDMDSDGVVTQEEFLKAMGK